LDDLLLVQALEQHEGDKRATRREEHLDAREQPGLVPSSSAFSEGLSTSSSLLPRSSLAKGLASCLNEQAMIYSASIPWPLRGSACPNIFRPLLHHPPLRAVLIISTHSLRTRREVFFVLYLHVRCHA
jgi:hypothetical protein